MTDFITTELGDGRFITWHLREAQPSDGLILPEDVLCHTMYRADWHDDVVEFAHSRKPIKATDGRLVVLTSLRAKHLGTDLAVSADAVFRPCGVWYPHQLMYPHQLETFGDGSNGSAMLDGTHAVNGWMEPGKPTASEMNWRAKQEYERQCQENAYRLASAAKMPVDVGGGGSGGHVVVITGDVTSDRWVGGTVAGSGGGGGATWRWDATQKPLRTASVSLVSKDKAPPGSEQRVWRMEPLRPDGFRQSAVDAAKAVLLSTTPKKVKP